MISCAVIIRETGKWLDTDCQDKSHFVCQNYSYHKTTFELKFQSEADLNDPVVQQQMLKQVHFKTAKCNTSYIAESRTGSYTVDVIVMNRAFSNVTRNLTK